MRKKIIIIGILLVCVLLFVGGYFLLNGLSTVGNPNGNSAPDHPYFVTNEIVTVKNIVLPKGTKLTYEEHFFREGQQDNILNEKKLTAIELPKGKTIDWGGVPVYLIIKHFNSEMKGYSVYADFGQLRDDKRSRFLEMWESCGGELGVLVTNTDDWTFNSKNIKDVLDCSVAYQRFFREDLQQQRFLDNLLKEIKRNGQNRQ